MHEELMQRIGNLLLDVEPPGFRRMDVLVRMTVVTHELRLTVYLADGTTAEVPPPDGLAEAFTDLRRAFALPGRGTWFSVRCVVNAPSRIDMNYNLDHEPTWTVPATDTDYARDLAVFPRDDEHVPDWLRERIARAAGADMPSRPATPRRQLTPVGENAILGSITTLLLQHLPGDWHELVLDLRVIGEHVEIPATVRTIFGRAYAWQPPPQTLPLLLGLRAGMYRQDQGTWYTMAFHLAHPNRYTAGFDRHDEPDWTRPPTRQQHLDELQAFPRTGADLPNWFRQRAGLPP